MSTPKRTPESTPSDVEVRQATRDDVDAIIALNKAAYPLLTEEGVVWRRYHVESHLRMFPEGQMVAEIDGKICGAVSSLIVSFGRDHYRDHTWSGITDAGMFYNHDPYGDTLYGADVNVHPDFRRKKVGRALYQARRELCQRMNLRRIVLGGRLFEYETKADDMSAIEYARCVEAGELTDTVLTFQLREGFTLKKVMPRFLNDPRSRDHGTFLEWINPSYRPRARKTQAIRVSCVQYRMRSIASFADFAKQVRYFVDIAKGYDSDFVIFPELLTAQLMCYIDVKTPKEAIRRLTDYTPLVDKLFTDLAKEFQISIVGGTHPMRREDRIENIASLYVPDGRVYRQPKLHVTPNERRWWGIDPGNALSVFETPKANVGILICYDSEFPEAARYLADQGAQIIFVPFCTDDRQAYLRVRYCCQARAVENQVYIAMAGTVGNLPNVENMDLQYARSAVLSPSDFAFARDGILAEADTNIETVITTDIDFEALEESINSGSVRQRKDRRPDLFTFESNVREVPIDDLRASPPEDVDLP